VSTGTVIAYIEIVIRLPRKYGRCPALLEPYQLPCTLRSRGSGWRSAGHG
jgi:hypothetical protein